MHRIASMLALQRQHVSQAEWRLKAGPDWRDTGRIFTNRHGGPLEKASTQQALVRACRAVGAPVISPHCQRHLAASLALQGGVPLTLVSRQLGHARVSIAAAIYGHALADGAAAAEAIGKALAR